MREQEHQEEGVVKQCFSAGKHIYFIDLGSQIEAFGWMCILLCSNPLGGMAAEGKNWINEMLDK